MRASKYTFTIGANQGYRLLVAGAFFKIMAATGAVKVESDLFTLDQGSVGQGFQKTPFSSLILTDQTGSSNVVTVLISDENFIDASLSSVIVTTNKVPQSAVFSSAAKTITNASGTLLAANASRQYVFIQNNDATGDIYINLAGAVATVANGVKVKAGEDFGPIPCMPTGAITAIGSIASNANVVAVEG